jgi:hypothetical protein
MLSIMTYLVIDQLLRDVISLEHRKELNDIRILDIEIGS